MPRLQPSADDPKRNAPRVRGGQPLNTPLDRAALPMAAMSFDATRVQRMPATVTSSEVLYLQRSIGNRATQKLLAPQPQVQAESHGPVIQHTPQLSTRQTSIPLVQPRQMQSEPVIQREHNPDTDPPALARIPTWKEIIESKGEFGAYPWHKLDWLTPMRAIYERIKAVRPELDDDFDVEFLDAIEARTDKQAKGAESETRKFDLSRARPRDERPVRKAKSTYGRFRGDPSSKLEGITKPVHKKLRKEDYAEKLEERTRKLQRIKSELSQLFPSSAGGFSAKGRAHEMTVEVQDPLTALKTGHLKDDSFTKDITIGTSSLSTQKHITKTSLTVSEEAGPLYFIGSPVVGYGLKDKNAKEKGIDELEGYLPKVDTPQSTTYNNTPVGRNRGYGQYINMAKTNATTYAWLTDVSGWDKTRWEWLHVRAASLGGATDGTNLVVGTRDCNTHMIPFESNLKSLAKIARENPNYEHVEVTYAINNVAGKAKHKVEKIGIKWKLVAKSGKTVYEPQGEAVFYPLQTGRNLSKKEVGHLEDALKIDREKVPT